MVRKQSKVELSEAIRKEIDSALGGSLSDEVWEELVEQGYLDEIMTNPSTRSRVVVEAAEKVRYRRRIYGTHNRPQHQEPRMLSEQEMKQPTRRSEVISILIAEDASEDPGVCLFRTEVLDDTFLSLNEVEEWIKQHLQTQGTPTTWLNNFPLSQAAGSTVAKLIAGKVAGRAPETPLLPLQLPIEQAMESISLHVHCLEYLGEDGWIRRQPTAIDGTLERLRQLTVRLAEQYKWVPAQATDFVLTGRTPLINTLQFTLSGSPRSLFDRIELKVDPVLSAHEVAEHYKILRQELMPGRQRNLSEKHMQLALFASKRSKTGTWAAKMDEWNRLHPTEWKYKAVSNFAHDCLQAKRRLLRS